MFAYVKYHDKYRAILPTSLIKVFSPKCEEDFDKAKTVQAFWRSEDGDVQGYYPAFVVALAGTGLPQEMVPEPAHDAGIDADAAHFRPDYSNEQDLTASGVLDHP
ncbi:hypothetical protein HPB49_023850 [Dermacentor silvarum]|uniref:Uncharacterized protein n=1 Tax=Dermacentor silvarum TaxID=543639 RepID=A0ACB8CI31_DERSI|nr:hypothetical protein HPB49_023850 [Dermacentor silvarum]